VNRVSGPEDWDKARERAGRPGTFSRVMQFSFDPGVIAAEPEVLPLLSTGSDFMQAVRDLAEIFVPACEIHAPEFPLKTG
jgi:hypothetical protein